jgi:hypothetical protein
MTIRSAPNGALGHYYLKGANGSGTESWHSSPSREDVLQLAEILYFEGRGRLNAAGGAYEQIHCGHAPRGSITTCKEYAGVGAIPPYKTVDDFGSGPRSEGVFGELPAIFVKIGFEADYQWVKGPRTPTFDNTDPVELGTINEFLIASGHALDWPAFENRLAELNHKDPQGSRSGDVLTVTRQQDLDSRAL